MDKYNEWLVSAFVAPNGMFPFTRLNFLLIETSTLIVKFVLLHDIRNEEGIRLFFMDVWESYVKVRPSSDYP